MYKVKIWFDGPPSHGGWCEVRECGSVAEAQRMAEGITVNGCNGNKGDVVIYYPASRIHQIEIHPPGEAA